MPLKAVIAVAAGVLVAGGLTFLWFNGSSPIEVATDTRVRHDDFAFVVERVVRNRQADGSIDVTVTVRVENDAKRVAYEWQPSTAYVIDASGRRYAAESSASGGRSIPAGQRATVELLYRLPAEARDPHLAFWDGFMMGDVFDGVRYARLRLPLQPTKPG